MKNLAFLFPGQGSQKIGMGHDLFEKRSAARKIFKKADEALGFCLTKKMFEGPKEELQKTCFAQPAILAHSIAALKCLEEDGIGMPAILVGHSLGEYSALVAASSLSFEDAIKAVYYRGQVMQEAVLEGEGAMAVVLGLNEKDIHQVCCQISMEDKKNYMAVANLNGPEQTVISGTTIGVKKATLLLQEIGARRILPLPVSAPFHCDLMKPAAEKLERYLQNICIQDAQIPILSNVTADLMVKADVIRKLLVTQVTSPVHFTKEIEVLRNKNMDGFIEIGPGKALVGIVKRMIEKAHILNAEDTSSIEQTILCFSNG